MHVSITTRLYLCLSLFFVYLCLSFCFLSSLTWVNICLACAYFSLVHITLPFSSSSHRSLRASARTQKGPLHRRPALRTVNCLLLGSGVRHQQLEEEEGTRQEGKFVADDECARFATLGCIPASINNGMTTLQRHSSRLLTILTKPLVSP